MNKSVAISVLAGALLFIGCIGFVYQKEVTIPEEASLSNYPELLPFQVGRSGFRGIKFDVDTNEYSFAFPVKFKDAESFFVSVEDLAKEEGWSSVQLSLVERMYLRRKAVPIGPLDSEEVLLKFDPQKREVVLVRRDVAKHGAL